jgi:hypothetical protein
VIATKRQSKSTHRTALDALDAPVDGPGQAAGLAVQVKAQGEIVHVAEGHQRHPPNRALGHLGEERVAQLAEAARHDPGKTIGQQQPDRRHHQYLPCGREAVHRLAQDHGHVDGGDLGRDQQQERDHHPRP